MNIYKYCLVASIVLICGCEEQSDLATYVEQVKNKAPTPIEPLPKITPYIPQKYESFKLRDPFSEPKPEISILTKSAKTKCVQPNLERKKGDLEKFSIDNLTMNGTLSNQTQLIGLISDPSGFIHQVHKNDFIGLNQGIINIIESDRIEITELIPDGSGCWKNRTTAIVLANNENKSGKK